MTSHLKMLRTLVCALGAWLIAVSAFAQMPRFDSLYVFGDSLADTGNIFITTKFLGPPPAVPPSEDPHRTYFNGRFTNGYVEFEYLWQRVTGTAPGSPEGLRPYLQDPVLRGQKNAVNFAYGGTGTPFFDQTPGGLWAPGLQGQVELFRIALAGRRPSRSALFAIVTGANDYRDDPFNVPMDPAGVVRNIAQSVERLYQIGARHVMVLDLPDLGMVPANAADPARASFISMVHNTLLEGAMAEVQAARPDLHLVLARLNPLLQQLTTEKEWHVPALDALSVPGNSTCLFINPASCQSVAPELFLSTLGFLFWDIAHPTTEAHRALGDYLYDALVASY